MAFGRAGAGRGPKYAPKIGAYLRNARQIASIRGAQIQMRAKMPDTRHPDPLSRVTAELERFADGASIEMLLTALSHEISRRTLQRRLAEWSSSGAIRAEGIGKARRYLANRPSPVPATVTPGPAALGIGASPPAIAIDEYVPISDDGKQIRDAVGEPIVARSPVGYRREFLGEYQPNVTAYLSPALTRHLHELGRTPDGERPAGTYARDIFNRLLIDLSWSSSRLEGNTYSLLDTERLLRDGKTPAGKDAKETQMILNHKAAIEMLVDSAAEIGVNRFTLLNLHALLADNLLEDRREAGRLRARPVGISGSTYLPLAIPQLIESEFAQLIDKAAAVRDPFEQSLFLMAQLPYLQPFVDVNKRTSRLAANIPLIRDNVVPLSFIDVPEQAYVDGLLGVYELNRIELLRDVFVWAYERSCRRYKTVRDSLPEPDPFRLAYRQTLIDLIGEIVRGKRTATPQRVTALAASRVPKRDLARLVALTLEELEGLHEGNIARFRIRPSELQAWRARSRVKAPAARSNAKRRVARGGGKSK
jgi:Fic family protein